MNKIIDTIEDGRYSIEALLVETDDGLLLYIGGEEKPHIGTVAVCQPRPSISDHNCISSTTSIINRLSHKDDILIVPVAESICIKLNSMVVATGGIHLDGATPEDIKRLTENIHKLESKLLEKINSRSIFF